MMEKIGFWLLAVFVTLWAFVPGQAEFHGSLVGWACTAVSATLLAFGAARVGGGWEGVIAAGLLLMTACSAESLPLAAGMLIFCGLWVVLRYQAWASNSAFPWRLLALVLMGWAAWSLYGWFEWRLCVAADSDGYLIYLNGNPWPGRSIYSRNDFPMGHANYISAYGVLMVPILLGVMWSDRRNRVLRTVWMLGVVLGVGIAISGGSRVAIPALALALIAALLLVPVPPGSRLLRYRWKILAGVVGLGVAIVVLVPVLRERILASEAQSYSDSVRADYLQGAVAAFKAAPLTGIGAGRIPSNLAVFQGERGDQPSCYQVHSIPFQWLAEYGLIGICLFLALSAAVWVGLRRALCEGTSPIRVGLAVAAMAYWLFALFDYQLNQVAFSALFALAVTGALGPVSISSGQFTRLTRGLTCAIFVLAAGVLLLHFGSEFQGRSAARRASLAIQAGDSGKVLQSLAQAMEASPGSSVYPALLAAYLAQSSAPTTHVAHELRTQVDAIWSQALRNAPNASYLDVEAAATLSAHDPRRAGAALLHALRKTPKLETGWLELAKSYQAQGRIDDAATAVALNAMILPERLFSPMLARGGFAGGLRAVLARFDALVERYAGEHPDDVAGLERLRRAREQARVWYACEAKPKMFLEKHPDWSKSPGWLHMRDRLTRAGKLEDLAAVMAYREILGASAYAYLKMDIRLGGAEALRRQFLGDSATPEWNGGRVLKSQMNIPVFGLYHGDSAIIQLPTQVTWEDDLFALLFVYENAPIRPHLLKSFFDDRLGELIAQESERELARAP